MRGLFAAIGRLFASSRKAVNAGLGAPEHEVHCPTCGADADELDLNRADEHSFHGYCTRCGWAGYFVESCGRLYDMSEFDRSRQAYLAMRAVTRRNSTPAEPEEPEPPETLTPGKRRIRLSRE